LENRRRRKSEGGDKSELNLGKVMETSSRPMRRLSLWKLKN
jgi:hypothetical protein